jgi:hypothetical protein
MKAKKKNSILLVWPCRKKIDMFFVSFSQKEEVSNLSRRQKTLFSQKM